jgi:integrase
VSTKLDEESVKKAVPPAKGGTTIWDSEVKGFGLRVYASTRRNPDGAKSFFINYRVGGVERRHTIGDYPTWTALAARREAKALRKLVDQGGDPAQEKREAREAPTVGDLAERYKRDYLPGKAPASQKADAVMIEKEILPVLGKRKVAEIHFGDAEALHKSISESKSTAARWRNNEKGRVVRANRVVALASKMFSLSLKPMAGEAKPWRDAVQGNPFRGIERNHEEGRDRHFSTSEIAALSEALAKHESPAADCIRLIMLTGARPGEAMRARWEEFADEGTWNKPSAHTKQRRRHIIPLSPAAIELIARLRSARADGEEYVFPGRVKGKPIREFRRVWADITKRAGIKDAVPYVTRHSFATVGIGGGLTLPIIGKLLGHTNSKTTERYAHAADDALREATGRIGAVIAGAGKDRGKVVELARVK